MVDIRLGQVLRRPLSWVAIFELAVPPESQQRIQEVLATRSLRQCDRCRTDDEVVDMQRDAQPLQPINVQKETSIEGRDSSVVTFL